MTLIPTFIPIRTQFSIMVLRKVQNSLGNQKLERVKGIEPSSQAWEAQIPECRTTAM